MNALLRKFYSKKLILGLVLLVILLYGWHYYFRLPFLSVQTFEAVPVQSALIIEFPTLPDLNQPDTSLFAKDIRELGYIYPLSSFLTDIRHLQEITPQTIGRSTVGALLTSGRRQLDWAIISDVGDGSKAVEQLQNQFSDFQITTNHFKDFTVYDFKKPKDMNFAVAHYRNLLIYGRYALLVEESINQLRNVSKNISHDRNFRRTNRLGSDTALVNILVQFDRIPSLLEPYTTLERKADIASITELGSWAKFSIENYINPNEETPPMLAIEGGLIAADGNQFLRAFGSKNVAKNEVIQDILPNNAVIVNWFGVGDFQRFYQYLNRQEEELFKEYFLDWIGEEFAYIITEPFGGKEDSEQFAVFKIKDNQLAISQLRAFEENVGVQQIYDYQMFTITKLLAEDLLLPVFGESMNSIQQPFYTIIEDYVIFGNSRAALEVWIDKYIAGQTLVNDISFLQIAAAMEVETSLFSSFRVANLQQLIKSYAKRSLRKKLEPQLSPLQKLQYLALNGKVSGSRLYLKGKVSIAEQVTTRTGIAWKMPLKYPAASAPTVIKNRASQQYEILVQDMGKNLYLLNRGGGIVWEKLLPDSIISTIHAIDYYRNGQTQYLFNTPNQIFLLDQNGDHVGAFPLNLQAPATAGVSVVDFDRNQDYNFFVPCNNGYIYGFNKTGRPVTGWNPRRGVGIINQPLQHFQRNGKDYIVAFNDEQKILAFKRDGAYRFRSTPFAGHFPAAPDWQVNGSSPRVVLTNTEGNAYVTNLFGESFRMYLPVGDNQQVDFAFCDLVGDARSDYIVLSDSTLATYYYHDDQFSKHFVHHFPHVQDEVFSVRLPDARKSHIGTLATDKKQITLLDGEGQIYPDFPLAGTSAFSVMDLFGNGERVLVVANGESVYAYRLR